MAPNVNNWARAAQVVTSQNTAIRKKLADDKPRYDRIGQASVQAAAKNAVNVAANNASTADTAIKSEALMRKTKIGIDENKKIRGIKKQAKMTGMLAGGAALIGYGALNLNKKEEADPMLQAVKKQVDFYGNRITKADADITEAQAEINRLKNVKSSGTDTTDTTDTASVTAGSQSNTGAEQSGALSSLTDKDFDDLAFAVSSEAALGTDDEFGVAANIVTRLRSGKYGGSISEIINAPGQYEGVYTGKSKASPEIAARFKTPEGRQKIEKFIKVLDGRTEFKGQTMINNRVKAEDPMFDTKGNFYHYAWQ